MYRIVLEVSEDLPDYESQSLMRVERWVKEMDDVLPMYRNASAIIGQGIVDDAVDGSEGPTLEDVLAPLHTPRKRRYPKNRKSPRKLKKAVLIRRHRRNAMKKFWARMTPEERRAEVARRREVANGKVG